MSARIDCLTAAISAVTERADDYGKPEDLFPRIAARWTMTLGQRITPRQVILCLMDMKMERAIAGRNGDTCVDLAGYAACLMELDGATP